MVQLIAIVVLAVVFLYSAIRILKEQPLIIREPGSATRNAMEAFMEQRDIQNPRKLELTSNEALKQALVNLLSNAEKYSSEINTANWPPNIQG